MRRLARDPLSGALPLIMSSQVHKPTQVVVTHALRTPIGRFMGSFSELSAADMGTSVVRDLMLRSGFDAERVGEVYFGNGRQAGGGPNPARQVSVRSGIPESVPATTINMACASGLKSIALAADAIRLGRYRAAVVGGTESMSGLPFMLPKMRRGYRLGHAPLIDGMYQDGFMCPLADMLMGETAEVLAKEIGITREEQDAFALSSQNKAQAAIESGRFADEISPVEVKQRKQTLVVDADEHPRANSTMAGLAKLPAVFDSEAGSVTAGNASGITDGAAALLIMDRALAEESGYEILAVLGDTCQAGVDPRRMGIGPVPAVRALQECNGVAPQDYDLIELNEAFAAQVIACDRELDLPAERLNVNGGSIALGHPIGATGARIVVTMLHELKRRGGKHALATLCVSGGMGIATAFHRED
ncbi:MAG: acetyl-CoA C-acetyltransferase [Planctomycetota bacterium]|jgi:acetyl-CoA C-acetyltransferase